MMKYCLFLLLAVVFCSSLAVVETAEATSKKEAVVLFKELQQNTVGEAWIDYDNIINLLEQGGSRKDLRVAFNNLMTKGNGEILDKVSKMYFELRLNPKPRVGGVYTNISGYIFVYDQAGNKSRSGGTVYFWDKERTILLYSFSATKDYGYSGRIWYQQYDARAYANKNGKYSSWVNNYYPGYPQGVLNFHVYY